MQDKAVIEIGKLKGDKKAEPYQNFIQDLFPGRNYDMIVAIFRLSKFGDNYTCEFDKVDIDAVSQKNYPKYAYRKGSPNGGDITFTTKFGDIEKKFKKFYPKQVNDAIAYSKVFEEIEDQQILQALKQYLDENGEVVKAKLQELYETLDKKKQMSSGFSIRFVGLPGKEFLGDFVAIQKRLYQVGTEGKSTKYKVTSEGHDNICSICLENKSTLHGFASPFKYSSVDKTGFVSGFFKQVNNWKNYPICSDCALDFELGQKYVVQNLSKYFYGKSYYIIPKLTVGSNPKLLGKALRVLDDIKYQESGQKTIGSKEDFLMRKIALESGDHNQFALNLLFYEENPTTKAIKIKLSLEEILPSRFRKLFVDAPKAISGNSLYKDAMTSNKQLDDLKFNFAVLRVFFGDEFYEIIQTVFLGLPLSEEVIFDKIMSKVRKSYIEKGFDGIKKYQNSYYTLYLNKEIKWHTSLIKLAMLMIDYLKELNIITKNKTSISMEIKDEQAIQGKENKSSFDIEKFKAFVEENKDFFDLENGYKVGIFSVGVLVRQVFNLQSANLGGNTPFDKKLKGYDLNPEILKNIYREALDKISRYVGVYAYQNLKHFVNEHFILNSHKLNQISNNELSFYFVAGLEFGNNFKTKKENQNVND